MENRPGRRITRAAAASGGQAGPAGLKDPMADTYRAWLRGAEKWQNIAVIDLRALDGIDKLLQTAGLKTLGEIDAMEGPAMLKLPGIGVGVVRRARGIIRNCKAEERRRRPVVASMRICPPRRMP